MKKVILILSLSVLFLNCNTEEVSSNLDKNKLLELINKSRTSGCKCGNTNYPAVSSVVWDNLLEQAAQTHSNDMNRRDKLSHKGSDGSSAGDRIERAGYDWSTYGENIAWNYSTEEEVVQGWLKSKPHCENIMKSNVTEMGVASNGKYWTQIFARPQ
jgi:uncharacterized protein YkwD